MADTEPIHVDDLQVDLRLNGTQFALVINLVRGLVCAQRGPHDCDFADGIARIMARPDTKADLSELLDKLDRGSDETLAVLEGRVPIRKIVVQ